MELHLAKNVMQKLNLPVLMTGAVVMTTSENILSLVKLEELYSEDPPTVSSPKRDERVRKKAKRIIISTGSKSNKSTEETALRC